MDDKIKKDICMIIYDHIESGNEAINFADFGYEEKTSSNALKELLEEGSISRLKHLPTLGEIKMFFVIGQMEVTEFGKEKYGLN